MTTDLGTFNKLEKFCIDYRKYDAHEQSLLFLFCRVSQNTFLCFWYKLNTLMPFQAGVTGAAMSGVVASEGGPRSHTSIPVLHAGSHFRHGLLQLMIHTIDPLHDGKFENICCDFHLSSYSNFFSLFCRVASLGYLFLT